MGVAMNRPAAEHVRSLLLADDPPPWLLQVGFTALLFLDLALRAITGSDIAVASWPGVGVALVLIGCVLAWLLPWARLPHVALAGLPVLDVAAAGLARLSDAGSGAGVLVIVPALWLGRRFGRRGAVGALAASLLLVVAPSVAYFGSGDGANLSRVLLITVVSGSVALVVAAGLERVQMERDEAERRGADLSRALETIEHQRRVSEAILDTVDVGLVLLDRDGAYAGMNRRHQDFMRLAYPDGHRGFAGQTGDVYGADGCTVLTTEEMPTYRASRGEEFDDCRIWTGADPLSRRALSVSARSVRSEDGRFAGAAMAYKDVTDFMSALAVKDEFIASVSHELRTPLTSIMGYVQMLEERDDLPCDVPAHLEVVSRNSQRLLRLVADLLHTAQLDDGPMSVVRTRTDLARIVRDSVQAALPAARAAQIELDVDVPESLSALVDAQRMAQVVDNLVSNAVKYSVAGGRVQVTLGRDGERIELTVADNGIGIDAADRARLFTRFFRSRDAEERSVQGIGLGLSVTKAIVESHGGRIEVDSEVGRGSVFRVRLPVTSAEG
ncbi:sensor histidine kinase [Myroides odoratimimus subsp. xuanwuensis]